MKTTRRELIGGAAALGLVVGGVWPARGAAPRTLALTPRAFVIDGQPITLILGAIDYFRVPPALWRDRLLRAKRAGVNAVATYVAWNVHEPTNGRFTFEGDADLGLFLDIAHELGMFAFPRVGPFICAEWEGGGHPGWLSALGETELRAAHPPTLALVRRYFERLSAVLAPRQLDRGGPIVMIQQENEFFFVGRPGTKEYQATLVRYLREFGITVPITDCNGLRPDTRVEGSMATLNGGGEANVRALQAYQPDRPAIVSELYTDYITMWGWPANSYPTTGHVHHQAFETVAAGGMPAYFMFHGGTNFGFTASNSWKSDQSFVTTRYYPRAPIAEGGALNPTYFALKAVHQPLRAAERFLTAAQPADLPTAIAGPVRANAMQCPQGLLIFVQPRTPERVGHVFHTDNRSGPLIQLEEQWPMVEEAALAGTIRLPTGAVVELAEPSSTPSVLPWALEIDPGRRIDWSNATLIGLAGSAARRVVILRGAAGRQGVISISGREAAFTFADAPVRLEVGGVAVIGLDEGAAARTWFADGRTLIGPAYVGEARGEAHECWLDGDSAALTTVSSAGEIATRTLAPAAIASARVALSNWSARSLPEIGAAEGWEPLPGPRSLETLGVLHGYAWYRARATSPTARRAGLFFTAAADRLTVFINGTRAGVWGRGPGAERDALPVELRAGSNDIVLLADNMGRRSEGALPDSKGVLGPAYLDAVVRPLPIASMMIVDAMPTQSWRAQTYRHYYREAPIVRARWSLEAGAGEGLTLSLRWLPQFAWVMVNGRVVAEHPGDLALADGSAFGSVVLDEYLTGGAVTLDLVLMGTPVGDLADHVKLIAYPRDKLLTGWAWRRWADPVHAGTPTKGDPCWWSTSFDRPATPGPFFLVTAGLSKGQAWLNGRALGRYWEIGPQRTLYLPEPWLTQRNRLEILDEEGANPRGLEVVRDVSVPSAMIVA